MVLPVTRSPLTVNPNIKRVVARFFYNSTSRALTLADHILGMTEEEVWGQLQQTLRSFARRHRDVSNIFRRHYAFVESTLLEHGKTSKRSRRIGGC